MCSRLGLQRFQLWHSGARCKCLGKEKSECRVYQDPFQHLHIQDFTPDPRKGFLFGCISPWFHFWTIPSVWQAAGFKLGNFTLTPSSFTPSRTAVWQDQMSPWAMIQAFWSTEQRDGNWSWIFVSFLKYPLPQCAEHLFCLWDWQVWTVTKYIRICKLLTWGVTYWRAVANTNSFSVLGSVHL